MSNYKLFATAILGLFVLSSFKNNAHNIVKHKIQDTTNGGLFSAGERAHLISNQFSFTEGASVDRKGNVFFTDQPNNKIWEYSTDGKLSVFLDSAGRSNGTYFDSNGNLIA